jgi:hypothetical protein
MPTPKAAIKEALLQLDQKNDALWTDDGSPLVAEVQRLCNDDKLTRAQINDAFPGFVRKMVSLDEDTGKPVSALSPKPEGTVPDEELEDMLDVEETAKEILARHVSDAAQAVVDAKQALADAHRNVVNCERIHSKKLFNYNAKFPPLSAAENIQNHLQRQKEIMREKIDGVRPADPRLWPIDTAMQDPHRANGRNRPVRQTARLF